MKKFIIIFALLIIFNVNMTVNAASGVLSVSDDKVNVGDSFKTTVNINDVAAWNVHVTANGPVKECVINEVDVTEDATDSNKTFITNCIATGEGIITLKLDGDITSVSDEKSVDISSTKAVTVRAKENSNNNSTLSNPITRNPIFIIVIIILLSTITIILIRKNISRKI